MLANTLKALLLLCLIKPPAPWPIRSRAALPARRNSFIVPANGARAQRTLERLP